MPYILQKVVTALRNDVGKTSLIFLAGDSTMDSKHWFREETTAVNGYETILAPPTMKLDLSYFANSLLDGSDTACVNCAVEEASLGGKEHLSANDVIIRDNLGPNDVLVVSIGGNDIALHPSVGTVFNMMKLLHMNSHDRMMSDPLGCWGFPHFVWLFKDCLSAYINKLISKASPQKIVVMMLYYPCEVQTDDCWAAGSLNMMGYYSPAGRDFLQAAIRAIYVHVIQQLTFGSIPVETIPMFEVLNASDPSHYCAGVEPSPAANLLIAQALMAKL